MQLLGVYWTLYVRGHESRGGTKFDPALWEKEGHHCPLSLVTALVYCLIYSKN